MNIENLKKNLAKIDSFVNSIPDGIYADIPEEISQMLIIEADAICYTTNAVTLRLKGYTVIKIDPGILDKTRLLKQLLYGFSVYYGFIDACVGMVGRLEVESEKS